jgi:hypothetical protein
MVSQDFICCLVPAQNSGLNHGFTDRTQIRHRFGRKLTSSLYLLTTLQTTFSLKSIFATFSQPSNEVGSIVSIDEGRRIEESDKKSPNAVVPSFQTLQTGPHVKFERILQLTRQDPEVISIDEGMQIDWSEKHN